jgi:cyanuric acid amidohydrolase
MKASVAKVRLDFPGDCRHLDTIINDENIPFHALRAFLSKVNGNGLPNDYSRQWAEHNFTLYLQEKFGKQRSEIEKQIVFITSSGCEGLITPHGFLFYEGNQSAVRGDANQKGMVIGVSGTRPLHNGEIGTVEQVNIVGKAVKEAASEAGISDYGEVELVFVKSPIVQGETEDFTKIRSSIPLTRAASALGVGLALGEVEERSITADAIASNMDVFSRKAFAFSGNETSNCRVIVLGNTRDGNGRMFVRSRVFCDMLDAQGAEELVYSKANHEQLIAFFAKVSVHPSGMVRGNRVALADSDLPAGRELRAAASGMFAALLQSTEVFVSAGAEHQGPAGGGVVGAIFRRGGIEK